MKAHLCVVCGGGRYVEALKEAARTAACGAHRREYAAQAKQLFLRTQTLMQRWSAAFQVRWPECSDQIKNTINRACAVRRDSSEISRPPSQLTGFRTMCLRTGADKTHALPFVRACSGIFFSPVL